MRRNKDSPAKWRTFWGQSAEEQAKARKPQRRISTVINNQVTEQFLPTQ
jgi:hypothetical protein